MSASATLETPRPTLEPGGAASVPLTVRNDGRLVDEYRFRVVGAVAPWAVVEPATVPVYPGSSETVTVLFRVPRSWEAPAGDVPFGVQVLPTQHPQDTVVVEGVLRVLPFRETAAELVPRTSEGRSGGRHRVAVDNRGNATIEVQLVAKDPEERLQLGLRTSTLRIAPGTVQSADLRVRPLRRIWRGTERAHPFVVEVRPDGGPGSVLAGTHRQVPVLPRWSLKVLKYVLVLGVIAALILAAVLFVTTALAPGVGNLVSRVRPCVQGAVVGDLTACQELLGADVQQVQGGGEPGGGEQGGGDQDGVDQDGADGGVQPEEVTAELEARAPQGETGQDVLTVEEDVVFTRLVLGSSEGDTGVFLLTLDGAPISDELVLEQFSGQQRGFDVPIRVAPGQELGLDLRCDTADDEAFRLTDVCVVTAELEGAVVAPGR